VSDLFSTVRIADLHHAVGMNSIAFAAILIGDKAQIRSGIGSPGGDAIVGLNPAALGHPIAHLSAEEGRLYLPCVAAIGFDHFVRQRQEKRGRGADRGHAGFDDDLCLKLGIANASGDNRGAGGLCRFVEQQACRHEVVHPGVQDDIPGPHAGRLEQQVQTVAATAR
jgi:hypothetical protein